MLENPIPAELKTRYDNALAFLFGRINYERMPPAYGEQEFKLDRMRDLMRWLSEPHLQLPAVHVAGTKGKGSTATMIAAVLTAAGYRTGLYTSPHLNRLEERFAIDGRPISPADLVEIVEQLRPVAEQMDRTAGRTPGETGPTYFELTTAIAFLWFARHQVDIAVLEVGLGGRLDATNVCRPLVSVITSISFDHTRQLGNTLAAIAREKAGIIKTGVPVVSGVTDPEPRDAIENNARMWQSRVSLLGRDFNYEYVPLPGSDTLGGTMSFRSRSDSYRDLKLGLLGRHQASNAAVALAAIQEMKDAGWQVPEAAVRHGLANARCTARVEVVAQQPTIVIDAAHNTASAAALIQTLNENFTASRRILVFGTTLDKDVGGMLTILLPQFEQVFLTRYQANPRAVPLEELAKLATQTGATNWLLCVDPATAWDEVRRFATPDDLVCITGSFFLAAEMRAEIERRPFQEK